jgi:hypothetical protein
VGTLVWMLWFVFSICLCLRIPELVLSVAVVVSTSWMPGVVVVAVAVFTKCTVSVVASTEPHVVSVPVVSVVVCTSPATVSVSEPVCVLVSHTTGFACCLLRTCFRCDVRAFICVLKLCNVLVLCLLMAELVVSVDVSVVVSVVLVVVVVCVVSGSPDTVVVEVLSKEPNWLTVDVSVVELVELVVVDVVEVVLPVVVSQTTGNATGSGVGSGVEAGIGCGVGKGVAAGPSRTPKRLCSRKGT